MGTMSIKNINKIYPNGVQAVFNFNLEVEEGELVVLVGPSGCGKSTTLRMIAGLEEISNGELIIDNKLVNDVAPKDRDIAMVFQNYALYSHMTVYHNMAFSLVLRKRKAIDIHKRVMKAAEILDLKPYLNRKPNELSGGQRQRVAIGRSIVRDPKVFLLDEPLSNLDAKLRTSTRKELKKLHEKLKATMIYVTHDQIEALTLADKIVVMDKGYIMQVGSPYEVYNNPHNLFVANFIGSPPMSSFDVLLNEKGRIELGQNEIEIKDHTAYKYLIENYKNKHIVIGVRPEYINVCKSCNKNFESVVENYELLGSDSLVHFKINNKAVIAKVPAKNVYNFNDKINYSFNIKHVYFFNKETGERIYG